MPNRPAGRRNTSAKSPVERVARSALAEATKFVLTARAGGRCEFDGCNEPLYEHHVTLIDGNFAEAAHIVAYSEKGPRGGTSRPRYINDVSNLMLLCGRCHKLIDKRPDEFGRVVLEGHKRAHEERIHHVTGLGPDRKTAVLVLQGRIRDELVVITSADVTRAVSPRYPADRNPFVIDLTAVRADGASAYDVAASTIERELATFYSAGGAGARAGHVSVFALAPIPVLVLLGCRLSNKVATDVFQRHRDTEDWAWKADGELARFEVKQARAGTDRKRVALILSLSGPVPPESLPEMGSEHYLYELALASGLPSPTFLRRREDLESFRVAYQGCLRTIIRDHGAIDSLEIFPAVPAPVAVLMGRELLPVDPALRVFDYDRKAKRFTAACTVRRS